MPYEYYDREQIENKIEEIEGRILDLELQDNETEFNDHLDALYGEVEICGISYSSSYALKNLDQSTYNAMHLNFNSDLMIEAQKDLETALKRQRELVA